MSNAKQSDNSTNLFDRFADAVDSCPFRNTDTFMLHGLVQRAKIVETLLRLDVPRNENHIAVVARLIDIIISDRHSELDDIIERFATEHLAQKSAVQYVLDQCFNTYDPVFMKKVINYTQSEPFTARDVLYDIAMRIRKELYSKGVERNA